MSLPAAKSIATVAMGSRATAPRAPTWATTFLRRGLAQFSGEPTTWYADVDFPESEIGKRQARAMAKDDGRMTVIREYVVPHFGGDV